MQVKYNYYKWLVWSILSCSFVIVFIHRFGTAVIAEDLVRSLQLTGVQLSNLAGMNFYAYALLQIPAGVLVDYVGPRKVAAAGMLLAGVGSIVFSMATTVWVAFLGRLIVGTGVSVIFISLLKTQAEWFKPSEFSTISGLTTFVGNLGSVFATTPLALLALWIGWRSSFRLIGVISVGFAVLIYLLVRNRPAELGFAMIHEEPEMNEQIPLRVGIWQVLKNKYTWPSFFTLGGFVAPVITFLGVWGVSYLVQVHGMSKEVAAQYTFYIPLGIMLGGPLVGYLSDRLQMQRNLLLGAAVLNTVLWSVLVYGGEYLPQWIFPPLFFLLGVLCIVHILVFTNAKEVNHPRLAGIATSVINTGDAVFTAVVNLLTGLILDLFWQGNLVNGVRYYSVGTYKIGFSLFVLCGLMGVVAAYRIKEKKQLLLEKQDIEGGFNEPVSI